jgi:hypothetical protein
MHGLTGGGWKRSAGHRRSESCPGETPGRGAETYRRAAPPRQPPTLLRPGVSSKTFRYLAAIAWRQVIAWLRRKHRRITWKALRRRYCNGGWQPADRPVRLLHTGTISTTRYRYRGAAIPTPGRPPDKATPAIQTGLAESPLPGRLARRVREAARPLPRVRAN